MPFLLKLCFRCTLEVPDLHGLLVTAYIYSKDLKDFYNWSTEFGWFLLDIDETMMQWISFKSLSYRKIIGKMTMLPNSTLSRVVVEQWKRLNNIIFWPLAVIRIEIFQYHFTNLLITTYRGRRNSYLTLVWISKLVLHLVQS